MWISFFLFYPLTLDNEFLTFLGNQATENLTIFNYLTNFRYGAGSYDEALIKAERALEIEEKELGARDKRMAGIYDLLAAIWGQVKDAHNLTKTYCILRYSKSRKR